MTFVFKIEGTAHVVADDWKEAEETLKDSLAVYGEEDRAVTATFNVTPVKNG